LSSTLNGSQHKKPPSAQTHEPTSKPTGKKRISVWIWIGGCTLIAIFMCVVLVTIAAYAASNFDIVELGPVKLFYATETPVPESSQLEPQITPEVELPGVSQTEVISELGTNPELQSVAYRGTRFDYEPSLAGDVWSDTMPEVVEPLLDAAPEHILFSFDGYQHSDSFHTPQIFIYPIEEFGALNTIAGEIMLGLEDFLTQKPTSTIEDIPYLPFLNAAQAVKVKIKYLNFQNGEGVRFLTQYGQDIWPINNHNIFYTFQGLTGDGKFYVSALFPISHPDLPADGYDYPGGDYDTFESNYESYITGIETLLNNSSDTVFLPDILLLDELIESLYVDVE